MTTTKKRKSKRYHPKCMSCKKRPRPILVAQVVDGAGRRRTIRSNRRIHTVTKTIIRLRPHGAPEEEEERSIRLGRRRRRHRRNFILVEIVRVVVVNILSSVVVVVVTVTITTPTTMTGMCNVNKCNTMIYKLELKCNAIKLHTD